MPYGVGFRSTLDRATILGKAKDHLGRSQPFLRRSAGRTAFPISTGDGTFTRYDHSPKSARRRYKHTLISLPAQQTPGRTRTDDLTGLAMRSIQLSYGGLLFCAVRMQP